MRIIIVSGLSGSGKSVALRMLEDLGVYCIDNIPAALLKPFISYAIGKAQGTYERTAVGLDARNTEAEIATVPQLIAELRRGALECEVIFLIASEAELLRRFAETRRKHPMSHDSVDLRAAMARERALLDPLVHFADVVIDTSSMGVHGLREVISQRYLDRDTPALSITFASFGYKHGIPGDADFVFDARTLPNPYWEPSLRHLTGKDAAVIRFLEGHTNVAGLIADISQFVRARIPEYLNSNRGYLTVAVGCTGGQHRSVYIVERLAESFARELPHVSARHSALLAQLAKP